MDPAFELQKVITFSLDEELCECLLQLSNKEDSKIYLFLLSAFKVLLFRLNDEKNIFAGCYFSGKASSKPGFSMKKIDFENFSANISFLTILKKLKEIVNEDSSETVDISKQSVFIFQEGSLDSALEQKDIECLLDSSLEPNLVLSISRNDSNYDCMIGFKPEVYQYESVVRTICYYKELLNSIAKDPSQEIGSFSMLTEAEEKMLVYDFNDTSATYSSKKTLADLFEEQVNKSPSQVALMVDNDSLTYLELNERSNRLAHYLIKKGVSQGHNVGLIVSRSFNMIISMYAILKAGAAYVPIDPEYPLERQEYILKQSSVLTVIMDDDYSIRNSSESYAYINICSLDLSGYDSSNTDLCHDSKQLAYTIYTSGSTGKPKGVMIEHHSVINLIEWVNKEFNIGLKDRLLFVTSMCFDLSVYDIFGILSAGGAVVIAQKEQVPDMKALIQLFNKYQITFWDSVPTTMDFLVKEIEALKVPQVFNSLKTVFLSGDWIPVTLPDRIKKYFPQADIISLGGATEGTIWSNFYRIAETDKSWTSIPYGRPIQNNFFYILNENLQPVPRGTIGELYIGGVGVAKGYAGDIEKTKNAFVSDPFHKIHGGMMYKTGDLGRMLQDMNMEFIGRKDDQVKIRGFRVELGEIESVLRHLDDVEDAIVVARANEGGDKKLIGYIIANKEVDKSYIITYLESKLPEYMVPRVWVQLDAFPLNTNGKIDKKALPEPNFSLEKELYVAPRTSAEKLVADILAESLGKSKISIKDNFFELGGHSLIAIKAMQLLEEKTGIRFPITSLFEAPTVEKLSQLINLDQKTISWKSLVPIKPEGMKPPLYIVHGSGLTVLVFNLLAQSMSPQQPVYGLQARGLNGETPFENMEDLAAYYLSEIIEHNPHGPYLLAGYSFGGIVAFEIAQQLNKMGKDVKMVAIFDTHTNNEKRFAPRFTRIKDKILLQFPKMLFIAKSFISNPGETLNYQLNFFKEKVAILGLIKQEPTEDNIMLYAKEINKKHNLAYHNYILTPFNGEIDLFRVKKRLYYVRDKKYLGWRPYAKKGVYIHDIPGDHRTFLLQPNYKELAQILQKCIDERIKE